MDKAQGYNIITGQIKKDYPMNSTSRRFSSLSQMKKCKQKGQYTMPMTKVRRLGTSTDAKNYIYGHEGGPKQTREQYKTLQPSHTMPQIDKTSLINATKLSYNPITHAAVRTQPKWSNTYKQGPLSKQTHLGRFNAPNYSKQFAEKLSNNATDFHRKKSACTQLCHIQKSYGIQKFFRKFK